VRCVILSLAALFTSNLRSDTSVKFSTGVLVKTAMLIALGIALPLTLHGVPSGGRIFLPMHLPVLLAGVFVGPLSGLVAGAITPLLSSLLTGMPPMVPPIAIQMSVELALFGVISGLMYRVYKQHILLSIAVTLLGGRLAFSLITLALFPLFGLNPVPLSIVFGASLLMALPGLLLQLILIPAAVVLAPKLRK